jgi:hypothetical protein
MEEHSGKYLCFADALEFLKCKESTIRSLLIEKKIEAFVAVPGWPLLWMPFHQSVERKAGENGVEPEAPNAHDKVKRAEVTEVSWYGWHTVRLIHESGRRVTREVRIGKSFCRLFDAEAAHIAAEGKARITHVYSTSISEEKGRYALVRFDPKAKEIRIIKRTVDMTNLWFSVEELAQLKRSHQRNGGTNEKPRTNEGVAESNARPRVEILGAAFAVVAQWRDRVVDGQGRVRATKVRAVIDEKAALFWPEAAESPLSVDTIEDLLRTWLKKVR